MKGKNEPLTKIGSQAPELKKVERCWGKKWWCSISNLFSVRLLLVFTIRLRFQQQCLSSDDVVRLHLMPSSKFYPFFGCSSLLNNQNMSRLAQKIQMVENGFNLFKLFITVKFVQNRTNSELMLYQFWVCNILNHHHQYEQFWTI